MKYRVIIRPEAENDLREAHSWYVAITHPIITKDVTIIPKLLDNG